ncbi:response regulator transcription factor [Chlamydiales bacterium]|nr:response regulator transcription factor [Chlamydiales bacterium]
MVKPKIVFVEDETDIIDLVKLQGDIEGYKVLTETDGINGYKLIEKERPDLVLLDIMLPGMSGLDICRKMKSDESLKTIPVIVMSAKSEEIDIVVGLELGADDYVTKPFSPKVLFSRVKAVLRRGIETDKTSKVISFGRFTLESDRFLLKKDGKVITLTLSEFNILLRLVSNRGKVMTRNQLLDDMHSDDTYVLDRNIDVHIASLRKKLGSDFHGIQTVRGLGYRFMEEE